jgi:hypothetical protein
MHIVFRFLFQSVRSFAEHAITLPPDGETTTARIKYNGAIIVR